RRGAGLGRRPCRARGRPAGPGGGDRRAAHRSRLRCLPRGPAWAAVGGDAPARRWRRAARDGRRNGAALSRTAAVRGGSAMTPQLIVASLLAMAVVTGWTRLLLAWRRDRAGERTWRRIALLLAQPAMAALLYLVLYPPPQGGGAGGVPTVLAEAADAGALADAPGPVFALPEAPAIAGVGRVPDLATVLRRHPGTRRVRVAGAGLTARDLDAALGIAIEPVLTDLPPGVWRVHVSSPVVAGATLRISGQAGGVPGGQVELRDPAGRRVDAMALPDDGAFSLSAGVHAPGTATFVLRVLDADGGVVESAPVATHAEAPLAPRVLLLSGAPNPETRALSRWMHDAGFAVQSRIALGGGAASASGSAEVDDPRL